MMRVKLELEGGEALRASCARIASRAEEVMRAAAQDGADVIRRAAEARAPRRTGFLASHITSEVERATPVMVTIRVGPHRDAFYGLFVEKGHALVRGSRKANRQVIGQVPPHPWLEPAFDESRAEAARAAIQRLRQELGL